jgi:molybdate transport system substrate-binding protein
VSTGPQRTTGVLIAAAIVTLATVTAPTEAQAPRAITIAAASDLQTVLPAVIRRFEQDATAKVAVSFGSSGSFFAQIQNGAPYDVYMAADIDYPRRLAASGYAEPASLSLYAIGRIVLWARTDSGVDVRGGLKGLTDARVRRIAIANPQFAPYGRAAEAALRSGQVYDAVRLKLVLGDNIAQTAQLVESGNATVGIIALSHALSPTLRASGTYLEIPATAHPPIEQGAAVLTASKQQALAREFLSYLKRPDIARLFEQFGFLTRP